MLIFCAAIAGCDGWEDVEWYAKTKLEMLRGYWPFKNGTPRDDTLRRFFRALGPKVFESCFLDWVKSFQLDLNKKVVAIDGKESRHRFDGANCLINMNSAFASELRIVLGQLMVPGGGRHLQRKSLKI